MAQHQHRTASFSRISRALPSHIAPALLLALAAIIAVASSAQAQTYHVLYNFTGGADGANPHVGVTLDKSGNNIYGTAYAGGAGYGTAYKLAHHGSGWVLSPLYSFKGNPENDGAGPDSSFVISSSGVLYGTTIAGGPYTYCGIFDGYKGCGTVFTLQPTPNPPPTP